MPRPCSRLKARPTGPELHGSVGSLVGGEGRGPGVAPYMGICPGPSGLLRGGSPESRWLLRRLRVRGGAPHLLPGAFSLKFAEIDGFFAKKGVPRARHR